jgi:TetR/AcrR family transcriptional regulator
VAEDGESSGVGKRWTATFERIPEAKRQRVLESAKRAFAHHGFAGTNVNTVAREAGISVGSLYQYFRTKEDVFLALVEQSQGIIAGTIDSILDNTAGFRPRLRAILETAVAASREDPDLINLYIACTTEELAPLAAAHSGRIEGAMTERYLRMIREAKAAREIRADADERGTAFCIDNLVMAAQFSFSSAYYRVRLALYLGESAPDQPDVVIESVLAFLSRALDPA